MTDRPLRPDPSPAPPERLDRRTHPIERRLGDAGGGPDVVVRFPRDGVATAGDLARRWPGGGDGPLVVDGRTVPDATRLGDLDPPDGALVGTGRPTPRGPELVLVGGPLPPRAVPLGGRLLIGSGAAADLRLDHPSVEPAHALLEQRGVGWTVCGVDGPVHLDDEEVHGPVEVGDARFAVGAVDLQIAPAPPAEPRHPALRHRPPRLPLPPLPDPGPPPDAPAPAPPPEPPGALTLVLPVVAGLALAALVHPTAGLFAAGAPVLAIGAHLDARRRHRRRLRRAEAEHRAALAAHTEARTDAERTRARRRRRRHPTPVDAVARATTGDGLWEQRPPADEPRRVAVGVEEATPSGPVAVALGGGAVLGIAGPAAWADAVRRAVLVGLTTRHGPADLRIEGPVGDDDPTRWWPHRAGTGTTVALGPGGSIEVAATVDALSERADAVLVHTPDGALLTDRHDGRVGVPVRPALTTAALADEHARLLARWQDPEATGGGLTDAVGLDDLPDPPTDGRHRLAFTLGRSVDGPVTVDLVADGPHTLVAGTTGAGKSEMLRTLVVGLARAHPPSAVAFVLVDYKGGSAFDACVDLPHVTGVVTDLDGALGERLLVALAAEVRDRERHLRAVGAGDLRDLDGDGPPRLVVVVDEFATLAAELPDVLGALVDVARRGRSLGVHLVLATQRPAGVVTDDIRANTSLRIALRTLDAADSHDVLGAPDAAHLPSHLPGRALLRRAGGDLVEIQVAVTSRRAPDADADLVVRTVADDDTAPPEPHGRDGGPGPLVAEVRRRWADVAPPDPVWLPPLPEVLGPADLAPLDADDPEGALRLGLVDDPPRRRQEPLTWDPSTGGLVLVGGRRQGAGPALAAALADLLGRRSPREVTVHLLHAGTPLAGLAAAPQVGACVHTGDRDAVRRLLDRLAAGAGAEVAPGADTLLVVDGIGSLVGGIDDLDGIRVLDQLDRLARRAGGPAVAVTAERPAEVPGGVLAAAAVTVVLGLDDPTDAALLGLAPLRRSPPPGHGRTRDGVDVALALVDPTDDHAVHGLTARWPQPGDGRRRLADPLPAVVPVADLGPDPTPLLGRRACDLAAVATPVAAGRPFVVSGPPRSGRTTALARLAAQGDDVPAWWRRAGEDPTPLLDALATWAAAPVPALFVVDDADEVDDRDDLLAGLVRRRHPSARLLVAVESSAWRTAYGCWLAALRPAAAGLALDPDPRRDLDCWTAPLPPVDERVPGRGALVDGDVAEVIQVALDDTRAAQHR